MIPLGNNQEEKPDFTLMGRVMDAYAEIEGCRCAEGYILLNPKFAEPWIVDEEHMKPIVEYLEKPVNKCTSERDGMCMIFEDKSSIEIGNAGYAYGTIIIAMDHGKYIGPLNKEDIRRAKNCIKHMKCKAFIDGKMMDIYKYYELLEVRVASDLKDTFCGEMMTMSRRSMPMAYISASWSDCKTPAQIAKAAQSYCDKLKEAGYLPVCPDMYLSMFLKRGNAKDKVIYKEMSEELLRRCRVLVVCDEPGGEKVAADVALAKRLRIAVTSLDGIESVEKYLEQNN